MWPFNKFQLYASPSAPGIRFVGGSWAGYWAATWPFVELYVNDDSLILKIAVHKEEYEFLKNEVIKIEIRRLIPIIGMGIRIRHTNKNYSERITFWYWSFRMKNLLQTLKDCGWGDVLKE